MNAVHPHEASCPSRLRFDQLIAGELEPAQAAHLEVHAAVCARCRARLAEQRRGHAQLSPELPAALIARVRERQPQRATRARRALRWSAPLLAAAALFLSWRAWPAAPSERGTDGVRTKGNAQLAFHVLHDGVVRPGDDGERVQAGDRIQFAYTSSRDAYLAIVSIDAAGKASTYYGQDGRAAPIPAAHNAELERSTELDATLGPENVYALLCAQPIELAPILRALEREPQRPPAASGCTVERYALLKVAR